MRGAHSASSVGVGVLERVLVLRAADAAVDLQVLHRLQVERDAVDLARACGCEARDDLVGARLRARSRGLSVIERRPLLTVGLVPSAPMNDATRRHVGIGAHDVGERALQLHHARERDVGRRLGDADDEPGVLLREEALGDDDREQAR